MVMGQEAAKHLKQSPSEACLLSLGISKQAIDLNRKAKYNNCG